MSEELTDDMRSLLRAAYAIASEESAGFYLEDLKLPKTSQLERKDCAFKLARIQYLSQLGASSAEQVRDDPPRFREGIRYTLTKLGRPAAKQLVTDKRKADRAWWWRFAKGCWATLVSVALIFLTQWTRVKFDRIERERQQPTTANVAP